MITIAKKFSMMAVFYIAIISCVGITSLSGKSIQQDRDLTGFNSISLAVSADLYLTQGSEFSLRIEGDEDILQHIKTEVVGNMLRIVNEKRYQLRWNRDKVKIFVTMPEVEGLSVSGSGDIVAQNPIRANLLSLKVSGSGDISIPSLTLNQLKASISGSGDLDVAGKAMASNADISISGSGSAKFKGIVFDDVNITISGSGDAFVEASETLKARVAGSGDILYLGNPRVDTKVSGSGSIRGI
ncbi:MAG: head GIN domain-containing protein [Tenuifilaceae bacterium]|nr:head GIN domain-containing protein [Tenuifilaceae bacterium]